MKTGVTSSAEAPGDPGTRARVNAHDGRVISAGLFIEDFGCFILERHLATLNASGKNRACWP